MQGLHIIADLYHCLSGQLLVSAEKLRHVCIENCQAAGLSVLGEHFYQFSGFDATQDGGATGAVVLAESHLAIHTWPERNEVSLDVYVCNVTEDNSERAEKLYRLMVAALQPGEVAVERISRGKDRPVQVNVKTVRVA